MMLANDRKLANDNKITILNGQKVNISTDITEVNGNNRDVVELKSVKYKNMVSRSQEALETNDKSGRIK